VVEAAVDDEGDSDERVAALDDAAETVQIGSLVEQVPASGPERDPVRLQSGGPVESLVGAEGLARLRARYAELMARINERPRDPEDAERLKTQAAELDPDSWVTDGDARTALETYEGRLEVLRQALGPRRRRSRRGGARRNRRRRGGGQQQPSGGAKTTASSSQENQEDSAVDFDSSEASAEPESDDPDS
jgi:hypothetical protein